LQAVRLALREQVAFLDEDRVLANDMAAADAFLASEVLTPMVADLLPSWRPE
jgi:histidine ammonia-lyase